MLGDVNGDGRLDMVVVMGMGDTATATTNVDEESAGRALQEMGVRVWVLDAASGVDVHPFPLGLPAVREHNGHHTGG